MKLNVHARQSAVIAALLVVLGVPSLAKASPLFFEVRGRILTGTDLLGVPLQGVPQPDGTTAYSYSIDWMWDSSIPPDPPTPDAWTSAVQGLSKVTIMRITGLPLLPTVASWDISVFRPCTLTNGVPTDDCIYFQFKVPLAAGPNAGQLVDIDLQLFYSVGYLFPHDRLPSYLGMREFHDGAIFAGNLFGRVSAVETIPEPSTLVLLGLGGAVLVWRGRKTPPPH